MTYAKQLTKERLIKEGFTEITKEGRLFKGEREVFPVWNGKEDNPNRYLCIYLSQRDSEGHLIRGNDRICKRTLKDGTIKEYKGWQAKLETFGLQRVLWAWFNDEVPEGYVVDHINNKHSRIEDYHLDNLQLLTPKENVTKERICNVKEMKCNMSKPRSFYEEKLAKYEAMYEQAKKDKDADACHNLRGNISQCKARLRYWDKHKELYDKYTRSQKDLDIIRGYKKFYKDEGNLRQWHQFVELEKNWINYSDVVREEIMKCILKY